MPTTPIEASSPTKSSQPGSCLGWVVFILAVLWVITVTLGRLATQWFATGFLTSIPDSLWASFPAIQSILLLLPLALLAALSRSPVRKAIYRTWFAAAGYVLLLAPVSLLFPAAMQLHALLNILACLLYAAILSRFERPPAIENFAASPSPQVLPSGFTSRQAILAVLVLLALAGIPWALFGALGSPLDTHLQILAGLAFGLAVTQALRTLLLPAFQHSGLSGRGAILLGGLCAAIALLIFSSGVGYAFAGIQVLLVISLLPLGWLVVYLLYQEQTEKASPATPNRWDRWSPILPSVLLIGLSAAFALSFFDPDELALVISFARGELIVWALAAAAGAGLVGIFAGVLLVARLLIKPPAIPLAPTRSLSFLPVAALLAWTTWLVVYLLLGQRGFYGEGLFVVLKDQADIASLSSSPDPLQRRRAIYASLVSHASASQAGLRQSLDGFGIDYTPYYLVNGLQVNGGLLVRLWLGTRPEIAQVLDNPFMRPLRQPPPVNTDNQPAPQSPQWNLTQIGADRVQDELGITGQGILIGQSDSGVQFDHPELADSYRGRDGGRDGGHNYAWFDPWNATSQPTDIGGHGTHTLGSVLGNTTGVAPDAEWIACTNLARNLGNPAYYLDCLQFMLAPFPLGGDPFLDGDPERGPHVLNNSWGCPEIEGCRADSLLPAVQALNAAGVFVVASAGNDGPACESVSAPISIYAEVLSVGATDISGGLVVYSSRGPVTVDGSNRVKPDLIAPGEQVLSAMPGDSYGYISGTSMASPHVAGTVALMWSANPTLIGDISRTREILASTAKPYPYPITACPGSEDIPSTETGYGFLDAYAAVQAALQEP
jgi:subtilisin family serine protease